MEAKTNTAEKHQYTYNLDDIKERLVELRTGANKNGKKGTRLTQQAVADKIGRPDSVTTINNWESSKMPTLPNLQDLMMLCNLYQVDLNYILAQTDIPSKTNHDIAKVIHTSEETISAMRNHPEYAFLVDALIESDIMGELGRRTIQLAHLTKLRTLVETAFPRKFIERIEKQFEKFYYTIFPLDMNQGSFEDSLSELLPYNATFDTEAFIEANFLEEAQTYLHNKAEDFSELSQEEQYHIILSVIADFSYDYFISLRTEELSKQRLDSMLSEVLDNAIQQKAKILQYR